MIIRDKYGNEQTWAWLYEEFGPIVIEEPEDPEYEIAEVRESDDLPPGRGVDGIVEAPAAIIVSVVDEAGAPRPGVSAVFSWPDAPALPGGGWDEKGVVGVTKESGTTDFAMGGGAYYDPDQVRGPHDLWLLGEGVSPIIRGLGMVAGTNHRHLDVVFQVAPEGPPMPPPPGDEVRYHLCHAVEQVLIADGHLEAAHAAVGKINYHVRELLKLLGLTCQKA